MGPHKFIEYKVKKSNVAHWKPEFLFTNCAFCYTREYHGLNRKESFRQYARKFDKSNNIEKLFIGLFTAIYRNVLRIRSENKKYSIRINSQCRWVSIPTSLGTHSVLFDWIFYCFVEQTYNSFKCSENICAQRGVIPTLRKTGVDETKFNFCYLMINWLVWIANITGNI